jgi:hypothetical protein
LPVPLRRRIDDGTCHRWCPRRYHSDAFIIFRARWRREREAVDPGLPVRPTKVEKIPRPQSGLKNIPPADSETLLGGPSAPSTSQMATVASQPIAPRFRPVPTTTSAPTIPPEALNLPPSPTPTPASTLNHDNKLTRLTPAEAQFLHSLHRQDVPYDEIAEFMRVMRSGQCTGSRTRRWSITSW